MTCWRRAFLLAVLVGGLGAAAAAGVGAADQGAYVDSADRALQVLRDARGDDPAAARRAAGILEAGTGQSQREILHDLRQSPPNVADAEERLAALSRAAHAPAFAPEPGKARRAVHDILAQPRYAALGHGQSLTDRIRDALMQLLVWVLDQVGAVVASGLGLALAGAAAAGLALLGFVVVRSVRWRGRSDARQARGGAGPAGEPPEDRFAQADRLAAAGDLGEAVRALTGAVAAALGGERVWEASSLTVRELFAGAPDPAALRPLLLAFETAVYGNRAPGPEAYRRAAEAAAAFRPARSLAA